jgi:hypothetical protein
MIPKRELSAKRLKIKKFFFNAKVGGVSPEAAPSTDDAVARDKERNRVSAAGVADGPSSSRVANGRCNLSIREGFSKGDLSQSGVDLCLKGGEGRQILPKNRFFGGITAQPVDEMFGFGVVDIDLTTKLVGELESNTASRPSDQNARPSSKN